MAAVGLQNSIVLKQVLALLKIRLLEHLAFLIFCKHCILYLFYYYVPAKTVELTH